MNLRHLLQGYSIQKITGDIPDTISGFTTMSKQVKPGYLYICIRGERKDGHRYAYEAMLKGAVAIIAEQPLHLPVPVILVTNCRNFLSFFADRFYGSPSRSLSITGITGTNGKTTTAHFLHEIYQAAGFSAAVMGTIGLKVEYSYTDQALTTPSAEDLHKTLWQLTRQGVQQVAMEVSSHALVQHRVEHCSFSAAVFTNLTREHLDYHGSMENYFRAKARLFELINSREGTLAVINIDDRWAKDLQKLIKNTVWTYGTGRDANIQAQEIIPLTTGGSFVRLLWPGGELSFIVHLHGMYNVYNALAAATVALAQAVTPLNVAKGIERLRHVPGRLEHVSSTDGVRTFLDYAHTPDGLEKVLLAIREYTHHHVILVFGCRGNRDRGKRPLMGRIAELYADQVILTSDNPAFEDPQHIAAEIAHGMNSRPLFIADREEAVHYALSMAQPGDIVLITGKGREQYQLIGEDAIYYSDLQSVLRYTELQ